MHNISPSCSLCISENILIESHGTYFLKLGVINNHLLQVITIKRAVNCGVLNALYRCMHNADDIL